MQEDILKIKIAGQQNIREFKLPVLDDSLETVAIKLKLQEGYSVCIDGKAILRQNWVQTIVSPSQQIIFVPDFGAPIIAAIWWIISATAGTLTVTGAAGTFGATMWALAVTAGIAIGTGYLIQALTPKPPKAQEVPSQAYSWDPHTTQQQGIVKPRIYGKMKCQGNIISGYVEPAETGTHSHKLKINNLIAYGDGPVKSISDIRINKQPITNFPGIVVDTRLGTLNQTTLTGFTQTRVQYRPNKLLKRNVDGGATIFEMPYDDYDDIEVLLGFSIWKFHKDGDSTHYSCGYKIEYRAFFEGEWAAWTTVKSETVSHEGTQFFWKKIRLGQYVTITRGTKYAIRVTKTSGDVVSTRASSELVFDYVTGVLEDSLEYPGTILVSISGPLTQDFSGFTDVSAIIEGLIVYQWNGEGDSSDLDNWILDWSDNPAYCGLNVLTQPIISGDGSVETPYVIEENEGLALDKVILDSVVEWAENSNTLCPDGSVGVSGIGLEKLITFNAIYDTVTSVWDALLKVGSMSRCIPIWRGNKVDFVVDKPREQSDVLASGNIIIGSFEEAFLSTIERISELEVTFNDSQKDFSHTILPVRSSTLLNFQNKITLDFFGVTKESEAWRLGRFHLRHNELLKRTIKAKADIDALGYRLGDRIGIQHDVPNWNALKEMGCRGSGRVLKYTSGVPYDIIKLDYNIESALEPLSGLYLYEILIRSSNNQSVLNDIISVSGDEVTIAKYGNVFDPNSLPQVDDLWVVGKKNLVVKDFVLLGIQQSQDQDFSLDLIEYNELLWTSDQESPLVAGIYTTAAASTSNPMKALTLSDVQGYAPEVPLLRPRSSLFGRVNNLTFRQKS